MLRYLPFFLSLSFITLVILLCEVHYLIATNGDKGCSASFCLNASSPQIALIRAQEAIDAAQLFNIPKDNVQMLNYPDATMIEAPAMEVRERFISVIRTLQPHVVLTWLPTPRFELPPSEGWADLGYHPDHQRVGQLVLEAVHSAGISRLFPDIGPGPWGVPEFYMFSFTDEATHYIELTSDLLSQKIQVSSSGL